MEQRVVLRLGKFRSLEGPEGEETSIVTGARFGWLPAAVCLLASCLPGSALERAGLDLLNAQVAIQATRNALLPSLDVYASYSLAGLDGAMRPTFASIFENNFPNLSYGVTLDLPIRNRTAQADAARALLEQRRFQVRMQDARNQTVWDVNKAISAVAQARDSLDATLKLVALAHQVLELQAE